MWTKSRVSTSLYPEGRLASGNMKLLTITVPAGKTHLPSSAGGRQHLKVAGSSTPHSVGFWAQSLTWILPPVGSLMPRVLSAPSDQRGLLTS